MANEILSRWYLFMIRIKQEFLIKVVIVSITAITPTGVKRSFVTDVRCSVLAYLTNITVTRVPCTVAVIHPVVIVNPVAVTEMIIYVLQVVLAIEIIIVNIDYQFTPCALYTCVTRFAVPERTFIY